MVTFRTVALKDVRPMDTAKAVWRILVSVKSWWDNVDGRQGSGGVFSHAGASYMIIGGVSQHFSGPVETGVDVAVAGVAVSAHGVFSRKSTDKIGLVVGGT